MRALTSPKEMRQLIKKRRHRTIVRRTKKRLISQELIDSPEFWLNYSKSVRWLRDEDSVKELLKAMDNILGCINNIHTAVGCSLDNAMYSLSIHNTRIAIRFLSKAKELMHCDRLDDQYFEAKVLFIEGRVAYLEKKYTLSHTRLCEANGIYNRCGKKDDQFKSLHSDIILYILKCMVAKQNMTSERYDLALNIAGGFYIDSQNVNNSCYQGCEVPYTCIIGDERLGRRLEAKLVNLGRIGNILHDFLGTLFSA